MTETIDPLTTTPAVMDEQAQRDLAARMVEQARAAASTWSGRVGY